MSYEPIPSLKNLYEISTKGNVRNARTRRILKAHPNYPRQGETAGQKVFVSLDGKTYARTIQSLLWEVHGVEPQKKSYTPIPVLISRGGEHYYFETSKDCAKYLSQRERQSAATIRTYLTRRATKICGWNVKYFEP